MSLYADSSNHAVYKALKHYQQKEGRITESKAPIEFINKDDGKHLYSEDGEFNFNLYKVFLFKAVLDGIKSGSLNLLDSERYMTWQHVNMYGEYDFNLDTDQIPFNLNKIKSLIIK